MFDWAKSGRADMGDIWTIPNWYPILVMIAIVFFIKILYLIWKTLKHNNLKQFVIWLIVCVCVGELYFIVRDYLAFEWQFNYNYKLFLEGKTSGYVFIKADAFLREALFILLSMVSGFLCYKVAQENITKGVCKSNIAALIKKRMKKNK